MTTKKTTSSRIKTSSRAKDNYTKQIRGRLALYEGIIKERKKTLAKAKSYEKYKLPGTKGIITREQAGINTVLKQIKAFKVQIRKLQKENKIYKIL